MISLKNLLRNEKGMTGLETAIILIAFVTVASVFSYAVLSAGLFSAEQGKETIYAGLQEASSNLKVNGSVIAKSANSENVSTIIFTLSTTPSGQPIDMTACDGTSTATNKCTVTLLTEDSIVRDVKWTNRLTGNYSGNVLKPGGQCQITIDLADLGDNNTMSSDLTAGEKFTLQVQAAVGASVTIERTLPGAIEGVMDLY